MWAHQAARDEARKILGEVVKDPDTDPRDKRRARKVKTLKSFIETEYGPWAVLHLRNGAGEVNRIRSRFPDLLKKRPSDISAWVIDKWRASRRRAGISVITINRDISALRGALNKAVEWGYLKKHPLEDFKRAKPDDNQRVRYLSKAEEGRLNAALRRREKKLNKGKAQPGYADHLMPMILLSLHTGLRRGELFKLKWADIEGENLTVRSAAAKGGKRRDIPLNDKALAVLKRWRKQQPADAELVFPSRNGQPFNNTKRAWTTLLQDAQITDFRWHDMRHDFASKLVMGGVDLNTVRELLGHSDLKMTLRYAHLAPEHKAAAVAVLAR